MIPTLEGLTVQVPSSRLHLLSGKTGSVLYDFDDGPMPDKCFKGSLYQQWTSTSVIANSQMQTFAISPYYADHTLIFKRDLTLNTVNVTKVDFPSTQAFIDQYPGAQFLLGINDNLKIIAGSHTFNGLFVNGLLEFFTTGRLLGFSFASLSSSQLIFDLPFLPSGRTEGGGRNYGVVAKDPASDNMMLIAGCPIQELLEDTKKGVIGPDGPCGVRRHVTIVNSATHQLVGSSFFSYSGEGNNSYSAGHWYLHVSVPGAQTICGEQKISWFGMLSISIKMEWTRFSIRQRSSSLSLT
jgi:hypothetical protein